MPDNTVAEANTAAILLEDESRAARRAYELRQAGKSWWEVAEDLQVSEGVAKRLLANAISDAAELVSESAKRQLLVMEVGRLDALMAAHWTRATENHQRVTRDGELYDAGPDLESAKFCADIIMKRAKLTKIDLMTETAQTAQTVVVAGTSEEYVAALRLIVGQGTKAIEAGEEVTDGAA